MEVEGGTDHGSGRVRARGRSSRAATGDAGRIDEEGLAGAREAALVTGAARTGHVPSEAPVVLEVALNGVTSRETNPAVPRLPAEVAEDAIRCLDAGATIVHSHSHDFLRPPEEAAELYLEAYQPILSKHPAAILYPTMGHGDDIEERWGHHERLARAGAIRAALVDTGSVTLGFVDADGLPVPMDLVYRNGPVDMRYMMERSGELELAPSVAVFEPGFLRAVLAWQRAGRMPPGTLVKLYFASGGYVTGGEPLFSPPPLPEALDLYLAMLADTGIPWSVAVLGGSIFETPIPDLALARGGHLRVGLEDDPRAASNLAEVERARTLCEKHGRRIATLEETESLLGLAPAEGRSRVLHQPS
jgi:uncharacterized protein (DUF849 family)